MLICIISFLFCSENPRVKGIFYNAGDSAISNGYIAIADFSNGLHIYDSNLNFLKKISIGNHCLVYPVEEGFFVTSFSKEVTSCVLNSDRVLYEVPGFKPRLISWDRNTIVVFPIFELFGENKIQNYQDWKQNDPIIQKVRISKSGMEKYGSPFFEATNGLKRLNFNFKGIWIFEKNDDLEFVIQTDPFVFREKSKHITKLDLPGFNYRNDMVVKDNTIFTLSDYKKMREEFLRNTSLIWGVFRFRNGFVVCYTAGRAWAGPYKLAFFDELWKRYGEIQKIKGKLIGLIEDKGIILTVPDDENYIGILKEKINP